MFFFYNFLLSSCLVLVQLSLVLVLIGLTRLHFSFFNLKLPKIDMFLKWTYLITGKTEKNCLTPNNYRF